MPGQLTPALLFPSTLYPICLPKGRRTRFRVAYSFVFMRTTLFLPVHCLPRLRLIPPPKRALLISGNILHKPSTLLPWTQLACFSFFVRLPALEQGPGFSCHSSISPSAAQEQTAPLMPLPYLAPCTCSCPRHSGFIIPLTPTRRKARTAPWQRTPGQP